VPYSYHIDGTLPRLHEGQVFVFGSNLAGIHGAGAARKAWQLFGARTGVGRGRVGDSYAIPTKDGRHGSLRDPSQTLSLLTIEMHVQAFIEHAMWRKDTQFFVTRIGCGLAGWNDSHIAPMFARSPINCNFAIEWKPYLG
jgi:hypothetical protein